MAPGLLKTCGFFGLVLMVLALIAIPCSAVDGQNSSAREALADTVLENQTGDNPESKVNSTETRAADTDSNNAPSDPASPTAHVENAGDPLTVPANTGVSTEGMAAESVSVKESNIDIFGNTARILKGPAGMDYNSLGSGSAIRWDGSIDTFTDELCQPNYFKGNDWVLVTNNAAINSKGELWDMTCTEKNGVTPDTDLTKTPVRMQKVPRSLTDPIYFTAISPFMVHPYSAFPVIYRKSDGETHLGMHRLGDTLIPENFPTDAGWQMISSNYNHGFALRTNGTFFGWGDNSHHQLDLPKDRTYKQIVVAGNYSVGLSANGGISLAGDPGDQDRLRSAINNINAQNFITIATNNGTAALVTHEGHIWVIGRDLPAGSLTWHPVERNGKEIIGNYTDVELGPDYLIALSEPTKELHISGPISPGKAIQDANGNDVMVLPNHLAIDYTHHGVTRVLHQMNGTPILWTNEKDDPLVRFPSGAVLPVTRVHYLDSGSDVDGTIDYQAKVIPPPGAQMHFLDAYEAAWYREANATLPRAMCFADIGCSAGVTAKQQLFLSEPRTMSAGDIPVFSVRQLSDKSWVGTLSKLGSSNTADTTTIQTEKNDVNPNQAINFSIMKNSTGPASNEDVVVTAQAKLTSESSVLHYTITGTASGSIPGMNITPKIWKKTDGGDVLVFAGKPVKCSGVNVCLATGDFTPNATASYFANATVRYVLPTNAMVPEVDVAPGSGDVRASGTGDQATDACGEEKTGTYDYWTNVAKYAKDKQADKGYSATPYLYPTASTLNSRLPNDYVFFYVGHCEPGVMYSEGDGDKYFTNFSAKNQVGRQLDGLGLSYARFVSFQCCESGATNTNWGNLVEEAYDEGADCVFGFQQTVVRAQPAITYGQTFWDKLKDGKNYNQAHSDAVAALENEPLCPSTSDQRCRYSLHETRGGSACNFNLNSRPGQSTSNNQKSIPPTTERIGLESAYTIAQSYAMQNYPDLWRTSNQVGVINTFNEEINHGDYYDYNFVWRDTLYYPNVNATEYSTITGPSSVRIVLNATGGVEEYSQRKIPLDPTLSLKPILTKEQALTAAREVYHAKKIQELKNITQNGLWVVTPHNDEQHLVWYFEAYGRANRGGIVWVDAHDGQIFEWVD